MHFIPLSLYGICNVTCSNEFNAFDCEENTE
jgi:hypothetical protein